MNTTSRQQHRDELHAEMEAARRRDGRWKFVGYVGGYCANGDCDVRQVVMLVKGHQESLQEIRCPGCRQLLLFGAYGYGNGRGVMTMDEYEAGCRAVAALAAQPGFNRVVLGTQDGAR